MEAADAKVTKLQNDEQPAPVNCTNASRSQQARKVCYHCGGNDHALTACKYKEFTCNKCKKRGHLARVCRSSDRHNLPQQQVQPPRDTKPQNPYHKRDSTTFENQVLMNWKTLCTRLTRSSHNSDIGCQQTEIVNGGRYRGCRICNL